MIKTASLYYVVMECAHNAISQIQARIIYAFNNNVAKIQNVLQILVLIHYVNHVVTLDLILVISHAMEVHV
jgi:hypothetical protein